MKLHIAHSSDADVLQAMQAMHESLNSESTSDSLNDPPVPRVEFGSTVIFQPYLPETAVSYEESGFCVLLKKGRHLSTNSVT